MLALLDAVRTDVRQALRRIVRAPGLSITVIVTLALAIAANTTIFSLLKPTVLRKLAAAKPDELVSIGAIDVKSGAYSSIHVPSLDALRLEQRSFSSLSAFVSSIVRVESGSNTFDAGVEGVASQYFEVLGVSASAGRLLGPGDHPLAAVGVVSERLAARLFGGENAVGRTIVVDGRQVEIAGVTASGFIGTRMDGGDELFLPIAYLRSIQGGDPKAVPRAQMLIGRLAPGVTLPEARAEVLGRWPAVQRAVAAALPAAQQAAVTDQRITVDSFARGFSGIRDRYGRSLTLVMALAAALLAVGCVNLSGLMLARGLTRQHEFAVRTALGVGRARLFQQALTDGLLLSIAALALAIPLSWSASAILTSMVSVAKAVPIGQTTPDGDVLAIATAVAVLTGLIIGMLPAWRAVTPGSLDALRGRGTAQRIRGPLRAVLMTQVALSMVLVVGAGLFVGSLSNLYENDIQDRPHPILFTRLARNPLERTTILRQPYFENLQARLAAISGANAASFSVMYPAYLGFFDGIAMDSVSVGDAVQSPAMTDYVTPGFFELYAITRLRGRDFTWADTDQTPKIAIVNEALARKLSVSGDVVGRHIQVRSGPVRDDVEIVGVVANATVSSIRERDVPAVYRPMMQDLRRGQNPMAHVRVAGDVAAVQRAYVEAVNAEGKHFVRAMFTMDGWVDNAVVEQQLIAGMAGTAAMLAMILASVGLFGMLAYSVSSRVREIGLRVSVGATQGDVVRMIVREGLAVAIPGVATGIPLALAAAWVVRSQLYGVTATDPWTIAGAAVTFIATAAVASWLPARRASRIQPIDALKQD
jgi:putative ABC transport system permease protein